jgi:hypothetical protein
MKKILSILFGLLIVMAFTACDDEQIVSASQLPQKSRDFLNTHFPDVVLEYVIKEWNEYDVYLSNGFRTGFNRKGDWDEVDGIHQAIPQSIVDLIPASIPEYVSTRFSTAVIVEINKETFGYEIELSNGLELEFSSKGNIREIDD